MPLGCLDISTAIVRGTATTGGFSWPRLQDLWDPLAQPAFTSPFAHHCMRRLKSATPCRTAESHGFGAALVVPAGEGSSQLAGPHGDEEPTTEPSTETAAVAAPRD